MPEERAIVREVVERLQHDALLKGRITTEVVSWDDPRAPVPMLAGLTPQQAVDRGLPAPSACDLTVTIIWGRMGTPLAEPCRPDGSAYRSGTEYEYANALTAGKPVYVYRRTAAVPVTLDDPDLDEKRAQKRQVDEFFASFKNAHGMLLGGYQQYEDPPAFRRLLEAHIKAFVRELLAGSDPTAGASGPSANAKRAERLTVPRAYREWLQARCASVELLGLRLKQGQAVRLNNVYVPLTTARAAEPDDPKTPQRRKRKAVRTEGLEGRQQDELLLDRIARTSASILGDPGSGKSTFCRWLVWLACEGVVPAAGLEAPDEYREHLAPALVNRFPILVPLRELWSRLPAVGSGRTMSCGELEGLVASWLIDKGAPDVDAALVSAHFDQGSALVVLDGLDEVPPPRRSVLVESLGDARDPWTKRGNRLVVSSRPYGLTDSEVRRLGLSVAPLQPLPDGLQWLLARRWFRILRENGDTADATAADMLRQVRQQAWLSPLTSNPLLLTAMCIVFGDGKQLPEDKHELYDRVVDAVLHNRIADRQALQLVRARLAVVAHGMHTGEGLDETRPVPQAEVTDREIDQMIRAYGDRNTWKEADVREVHEKRGELVTETGLLLQRGNHQAQFLHLSFQEFLAAQRCADVDGGRLLDLFTQRSEAPEWRNTLSFVYGNMLAASTTPERAVRMLTDLIDRLEPERVGLTLVVADAVEIFQRRKLRLANPIVRRVFDTCLAVMRGGASALERCRVGDALGKIGDPRFRADLWYLPDDPLLGFVEVPAGLFTMGSDKTLDPLAYDDELHSHDVKVPTYYIARWPVTVAQFKAFVDDPNNDGFEPGDPECVAGPVNHPVANVTWHESVSYCRWLEAQLRASTGLPEALRTLLAGSKGGQWHVTLASEAEWEKAARGSDGRIYPWGGNELDPDRTNCAATIGSTSAVGCFSGGASLFGVEDLSGNVFEWTRSIRRDYPYVARDGRENLVADGLRVLRGGSFVNDEKFVRAAYRNYDSPGSRYYYVGFRVVVSRSRIADLWLL